MVAQQPTSERRIHGGVIAGAWLPRASGFSHASSAQPPDFCKFSIGRFDLDQKWLPITRGMKLEILPNAKLGLDALEAILSNNGLCLFAVYQRQSSRGTIRNSDFFLRELTRCYAFSVSCLRHSECRTTVRQLGEVPPF